MALVTSTEMFKKAYAGGYAIGAFNVNNMEIVQGITEACGELKAPVILQVSKGARAFSPGTLTASRAYPPRNRPERAARLLRPNRKALAIPALSGRSGRLF